MTPVSRQPPGIVDFALLVGLACLFGASFMFTHLAVADIPPITLATSRVVIASLVLYPIMLSARQRLPTFGKIWVPILASAVLGYALPFALVGWGQIRVPSGLAAIFMAVMPLATIMLAHVFTHDEKLNRWKIAGVLSGLLGVVVLFGFDALANIGGPDAIAQLAILAAAVCYALNALITRALVDIPKLSMLCALMISGSILILPVSLFFEAPLSIDPSWQAIASVAMLAIGPTATATLMILVIINRQGASFLSQINFMVPLFGVMFGVVLLDERLSANAWIALVFVLAGVALSRLGNRASTHAPIRNS